jgi:von Willebrand factor type A domain
MIKVKFKHPDGKTFSTDIEETIEVGRFISQLKSKQILNSDLTYSLRTESGVDVPETALFRLYAEKSFIISEFTNGSMATRGDEDDDFLPPTTATFYQLGIFVIDGSGSMHEKVTSNMKRTEAVDIALRATLAKFKISRKKECFLFTTVAFGDTAQQVSDIEKAENCVTSADYTPTNFFNNGHGSGSTNIYAGLSKAYDIAKNFLNNRRSKVLHKVSMVVLSDGMCHHESHTKSIADTIKQLPNVEIFCCHLQGGEPDAKAQNLLKSVASSPNHYKTVTDENTIRSFFISSLSSGSGTTII